MKGEPPLSGTAEVGGIGRPVTVLVADDNDVAVRLCRRVLEKAGYKVLAARDGLEAVAVALANSPDVIVMDVAMPGIDGLEATRRIKLERPGIAIVIASVLANPSTRERFLAAGADEVMMKPLRLVDLTAAVASLAPKRGPQATDVAGARLGAKEAAPETLTGDRGVPAAAKSSEPPRSRRWPRLRLPAWRSRRHEGQSAPAAMAADVAGNAGYGPLDALLDDQSVSKITVSSPDEVFIERGGVLTRSKVRFDDENQLLETIQRLVATTGQHIDAESPMVEAYLPDGRRLNAVLRPASTRGPALTIRRFTNTVLTMDDLISGGNLSPGMAEFLQAAVVGRLNILVAGATGSGKTATLNALARFIPHSERMVTVEEGAELKIGHPHIVSLVQRPAVGGDKRSGPTIRQLLHQGTRMLPDRILVGELRGAEAADLLEAMRNGQDGSMSTISSNSARDALARLETMVRIGSINLPLETIWIQIASALNLIVQQGRLPDGRRKVVQIAEVVGYDANGVILRDIFLLGMGSDLRLEYNATGYVPASLDKAAFFGVMVNEHLFDPVKSHFVPAGSDSFMPVVKDPLVFGRQGSGAEGADGPVGDAPSSADGLPAAVLTHAADPDSMPPTREVREEMATLIAAARSAVADLQAAASQPVSEQPVSFGSAAGAGDPADAPDLGGSARGPQVDRGIGGAEPDLKADESALGIEGPAPKASRRRSTRQRT